jgi:hypothetical protein
MDYETLAVAMPRNSRSSSYDFKKWVGFQRTWLNGNI